MNRRFDIAEQPCGSGGHGSLWKIYSAIEKQTGRPVSLFVFDKKMLAKVATSFKERLLDLLRKVKRF